MLRQRNCIVTPKRCVNPPNHRGVCLLLLQHASPPNEGKLPASLVISVSTGNLWLEDISDHYITLLKGLFSCGPEYYALPSLRTFRGTR